ncbi:head maturation protease, ClpP-related [Mucilaginibacter defluvii]|uniref:ATP-dependent Clp protease proteolytic subunit n=1 Tax=Mucilaginibacter defluvii TaxID=1196019 RepID=A0ABP9FN11_9SPHI
MKIYLYDNETDSIGSGSLSSAHIKTQLDVAAGADVDVHISSAGGSAFDAIAIYDMLKKYPGTVTVYIDALAASAASVVAMAGDTVVMGKYALLMIHKPMVGSGGNADELLKDVQMLNVVQERLAQIYMDRSGLDGVTINSLINAVTWMAADQALSLGFIDRVDDYSAPITNSLHIKQFASTAPAVYQRCINKILNTNTNMNTENKELIEKTATVLDKIMNFFKRVVNKHTITDKCTLHHEGELAEGSEVYQDEEMHQPAGTDIYTTANGKKLKVTDGLVEQIEQPAQTEPDEEPSPEKQKQKLPAKKMEVENRIQELKARLHAQNALLTEARAALETANTKLSKTTEQVRNEIRSDFMPVGSKRSAKAKTEEVPFFTPQSELARTAVKKAVQDKTTAP